MEVERIKIDDQGRVKRSKRRLRHRKINKKDRDIKRFTRSKLKNLTKSDKHYDHGVFKNARIMKAQRKEPFHQNYEMETHCGGVRYPYDDRCHPAHTPKQ